MALEEGSCEGTGAVDGGGGGGGDGGGWVGRSAG